MKPLIYGYMRVDCDAPDREIDHIEQHMRRFADVEGFSYATTLYEYQPGSCTAFEELAEELGRADARPVIVPSFAHLSPHRILRNRMVERLEHNADAQVFELGNL